MMMLIFAYFLTSERAIWELWLYAFYPRKSGDELKGHHACSSGSGQH